MDVFIIYGLTILAMLITLGAQAYISSSYKKYAKVKNEKGYTGKEVARQILDKNGLTNVKVEKVTGYLSDHYDPKAKVVSLSTDVYDDASVASIAIASHECGHAIQDKNGYTFLRIRKTMVPFVNLCSYAGYIAIILGSILGALNIIWLGILAEVVILVFQLVTLPVEFDASRRGLKESQELGFYSNKEYSGGKTVLRAAALTYVASLATVIIEVLRLVLMYGRRSD